MASTNKFFLKHKLQLNRKTAKVKETMCTNESCVQMKASDLNQIPAVMQSFF